MLATALDNVIAARLLNAAMAGCGVDHSIERSRNEFDKLRAGGPGSGILYLPLWKTVVGGGAPNLPDSMTRPGQSASPCFQRIACAASNSHHPEIKTEIAAAEAWGKMITQPLRRHARTEDSIPRRAPSE